jgi:hypothetical protein
MSSIYYSLYFMEGSVADADPGSGVFLTTGSGIGKKSGYGSAMNSPDHISESLETNFLGLNTKIS